MSSVTEVRTFADIYGEILSRMRQNSSVTAIVNQAKRYANTGMHEMVFGFEYKLPWLERDSHIITAAPYTTGTIQIDRGSTTLNGTSTLWTTTNDYGVANARTTGKFNLGTNDIYTIASVGGAGTVTLNERYVASDDLAAGASYTYYEDEYTLASDFLKPLDWKTFSQPNKITLIGRNDFRRAYPWNVPGTPRVATLLDKSFDGSTTPVFRVQFYPYPSTNLLIPYSYITKNLSVTAAGVEQTSMVDDTDEPALPIRYRNAIVLYGIYTWYRDKKDDIARAEGAKADYQDEVNRIVGDQRMGANTTMQLTPKVSMYTNRTPYRAGINRRYSTNDSFDNFRT